MMKKYLNIFTASIKSPQGFFAWVAFILGGVFLLIIPPFQTPDEAAHFLRAYQVSNLDFIPIKKDNIIGSYLPTSIQKTETAIDGSGAIQTHANLKYRLGNTKAALLNVPLNEGEKKFVDTTVTASYSPIGYIPQVLAIWFGRLFDTPPIVMVYLARLFVLVTWIGLVFASIKIFPFKKWAVAGIALLPMFLAQAVSLGVDVLAVGSGLLFLSTILYCIYTKNTIHRKILFLLLATGIVMTMSKQVMAVLLFLILTLKNNSLSENVKKNLFFKILIILLPILILILWTIVLPEISSNVTQLQNNQDTVGQVKYIMGQPLIFIRTLFYTLFFTWGDGISQSLIGNFGWLDTPLSSFFINLGYVSLFAYWFVDYEKKSIQPTSKLNKTIFFVITATYFLSVCAAMYILFSPVGYPLIVGIQGRYLFPCLFLLLPVLFVKVLTTKERYFVLSTKVVSITLLVASIVTIVYRYYIYTV